MATADNLQFGGATAGVVRNGRVNRIIDLSKNELGASIASGDQIYFDKAPAGTKVIFHRADNVSALTLGTSTAIYIGDTSVTSRFVSNSALNTASAIHSLVSGANTTGQEYTSATDLCITLIRSSGAAISGKINLVYEFVNLNGVEGPTTF